MIYNNITQYNTRVSTCTLSSKKVSPTIERKDCFECDDCKLRLKAKGWGLLGVST